MNNNVTIPLELLEGMLKEMYLKGKLSIISPEESHNLGFNGILNDMLVDYNLKQPSVINLDTFKKDKPEYKPMVIDEESTPLLGIMLL